MAAIFCNDLLNVLLAFLVTGVLAYNLKIRSFVFISQEKTSTTKITFV